MGIAFVMPLEDSAATITRVAELLPQEDLDAIERVLRDALRRQRDNPHLNVLLGIVLCRSGDWDRAAAYLDLAELHASDDRYVADQVAAMRTFMGDPRGYKSSRAALERRQHGLPKSAPPPSWPSDIARDLRSAVLRDDHGRRAATRGLVASIEAGDPDIDAFLDRAVDSDFEWADALRELRRRVRANDV